MCDRYKLAWFCLSMISLMTISNAAKAQDGLSGIAEGAMRGAIDMDNVDTSPQTNMLPDAGNASQRFFKQGTMTPRIVIDDEDSSDNILEIDKTVEAEGVDWESFKESNRDRPINDEK